MLAFVAFTEAQEVEYELAWPVAQDVTYCCGNHKPSHCGRANELSEFERKYGCQNWKVERRDNYDDATTASESSRFEQAEVCARQLSNANYAGR